MEILLFETNFYSLNLLTNFHSLPSASITLVTLMPGRNYYFN